jgi:amyloid beta precursor protein binding protein 1
MLTDWIIGIGKFTIVDDAIVSEADLGVNFFLDESCLGKLRSQSCTELLQELNPEVEGDWFPKSQVRILSWPYVQHAAADS